MNNLKIGKCKEHHDVAIRLINTKIWFLFDANHNGLYWASCLPIAKLIVFQATGWDQISLVLL